jgi:hypothetical protein
MGSPTLWVEMPTNVTVTDGRYLAALGSVGPAPLDTTALNGDALYASIQVDGNPEFGGP